MICCDLILKCKTNTYLKNDLDISTYTDEWDRTESIHKWTHLEPIYNESSRTGTEIKATFSVNDAGNVVYSYTGHLK